MSEPENFLARWSRRKQESEQPVEKPDGAPSEQRADQSEAVESAGTTPTQSQEPAFDLSSLPSIDSIGSGTDVRVFLQKGVPLELTRAALRRAWVSDPAIRDFIEVAENQWDFATGSGLPGFGPLDASDDVRRLVAEVFQDRRDPPLPENENASLAESRVQNLQQPQISGPKTEPKADHMTEQAALQISNSQNLQNEPSTGDETIVHRDEENIASQQDGQKSIGDAPTKRAHGRALPQ